MDEVPDSVGCDNYSYYWLKGVRVAFLLDKGLLEVGIEVDSIDCCRGKRGGSGMFPVVVALIYIGV